MANSVLRFEQVCKKFSTAPARYIIHNLSFELSGGESLGITGPNGAGKTTLLLLAAGLLSPDRGRIGRPDDRSEGLAFLPEKENFPLRLSARQYLSSLAAMEGLPSEAIQQKVTGQLKRFALLDCADQNLYSYSGGMLKRLALASLSLRDCLLYVLDEPVDNLDPSAQGLLQDWMAEQKNRGAAILFSTHHVSGAAGLADRIMVMAEGQCAFLGTSRDFYEPASGYAIRFDQDIGALEKWLSEQTFPWHCSGSCIHLLSEESRVREELLRMALEHGLVPSRLEPISGSPEESYRRILEKFRAGKGL